MKKYKPILLFLPLIVVSVLSLFFFPNLVIYTLIALILSLIGKSFVNFLHKKAKLSGSLSAIFFLLLFLGVFVGLVFLLSPVLLRQINSFSKIDFAALAINIQDHFKLLMGGLENAGIHIGEEQIQSLIKNTQEKILGFFNVPYLVSSAINIVSFSFMGLFSVLFITFFLLRDQQLFSKAVFLFIPTQYTKEVENILNSSQNLLARYFKGLGMEIICMMILISSFLAILGVKNALLFGFLGGLLNVIPYLGPLIGACLCCILGLGGAIGLGISGDELFWLIIKIAASFSAANLIDNFVLQVYIYSNSVKAHPLEIFFVIMMAGTIFGVGGMIIAIPTYTVLRIIAKEFFQHSKIVHQLTRNL